MHIDPVLERFRKGEGCRKWRLRVSERRGIEPGLIKEATMVGCRAENISRRWSMTEVGFRNAYFCRN
uniref:Uncharacterized protein n=1 Tax=Picea sitchensis TaxID=3332 RepID=B8LRR3_PICSI|nr:unknown [Picea sitchensis]